MFDGTEVDVLALGDADCIVVTQWTNSPGGVSYPFRILVDAGSGGDAGYVSDFLKSRGYDSFWAAVCTHPHKDHARGLVKLVQDRSISFAQGWMHDIRNHLGAETLRRAEARDDGVKEAVETTRELAAAFKGRGIMPKEPFSGATISHCANMRVLGPTLSFYRETIEGFTGSDTLPEASIFGLSALDFGAESTSLVPLSLLGRQSPLALLPRVTAPPQNSLAYFLSLTGALSDSSVKEKPSTQPFNNTSVILGISSNGGRLMLTGDAGSDALGSVSAEWNHLLYMGVPHHGSDGNLSQKDIERFCPAFATISARGDASHPSRAIVSGLVKIGAKVASTHKSGNLWFCTGRVPHRPDYGPAELLKGTGEPTPVIDLLGLLGPTPAPVFDWTTLLPNTK